MTSLRQVALLAAVILTVAQALETTRWPQAQETTKWPRLRRQFPGSEWVPLTQPCPTCRPLADPADTRTRFDDIGLVPPRPPTPRQLPGFFPQNQGLLQGGFPGQRPFQNFLQFNPQFQQQQQQQQPFFTQQQQQSFLPQTYLNNPQLLLNENPQLLPLVNNPLGFVQQQQQQPQQQPQQQQRQHQQFQSEKLQQQPAPQNSVPTESKDNEQIRFRPDSQKVDKLPQNVRLEGEKPGAPVKNLELPSNAPPQQFLNTIPGSFQQQRFSPFPQFAEQQSLFQVNPSDPFLTPTPFGSNNGSDIVIPGLEKEEIQLLYVPVETLRQRGHLQGHTVDEPKGNFQNPSFQQLQQFSQTQAGHFITQSPNRPTQFSPTPALTPPPVLTQNLPFQDAPQQFATEPPSAPPTTEQVVTIQPRPVSTVRQPENVRLTPRPSPRPTETRTTASAPFTQSSKGADNFLNEVTPSFPNNHQQNLNSLPQFLPQQPFQQLVNEPHRFSPRPTESFTEVPIQTTTLQPHQPPLSVYMGSGHDDTKVIEVLRALKDAPSIAVLDSFSPRGPKVFVGPANLNAPAGFAKFELPYLSNLESNALDQNANLPFFVAPLNFVPPEGYTKIPFPAPHVGSVVVSTKTEERPADQQERASSVFPSSSTQATIIEQEVTTPELPETTTLRSRGRRPNQYRSTTRKPVNSRQRATVRPLEEETSLPVQENQVNAQEILREERKRITPSRRQRVRTTTEPFVETSSTDAPVLLEAQGPAVELQHQMVDFDQPQPPLTQLQQPIHPPVNFRHQPTQRPVPEFRPSPTFQQQRLPQSEFTPPPPPPPHTDLRAPTRPATRFQPDFRQPQITGFGQPDFVQQTSFFDQYTPNEEVVPGVFEMPKTSQQPELPTVETNGDSGFQKQTAQNEQFVSTEQPISSTQFFENTQSSFPSSIEPEYDTENTVRSTLPPSTSTTQKEIEQEPEAEKIQEEPTEAPKKSSRLTYPNVPGVKSHPSPTKARSHVRSRPRVASTTTSTTASGAEDEEPSHVEVSATGEDATSPSLRTTSKYHSHFNRTRKPLRSSTPRAETPSTTASPRTVRPLRRSTSTPRTSMSTKRIRKPTTPTPFNDDEENEPKKEFVPSAASNEIFSDQPSTPLVKPKARKSYFPKHKTTEATEAPSASPSTHDEGHDETVEESKHPEVSATGSDEPTHFSGPSGPSAPTAGDGEERKKYGGKKSIADDLNKKGRRRLRVRVQKRPHDNFETAESQNHGSLANALLSSVQVKPTAPDLYRFSQGEFDFESSGKFIGTQQKGHVRNITADILESTSTFSSPGLDTEVHRVTIASEATTEQPEEAEEEKTVEPLVVEEQTEAADLLPRSEAMEATTTPKHDTTRFTTELETTQTDSVETTTAFEDEETTATPEVTTPTSTTTEPTTTVTSTTTAPTSTTTTSTTTTSTTATAVHKHHHRNRKVLKTSTTTQISHETEICYKGKCIKTNADNPEKALKRLVESTQVDKKKS